MKESRRESATDAAYGGRRLPRPRHFRDHHLNTLLLWVGEESYEQYLKELVDKYGLHDSFLERWGTPSSEALIESRWYNDFRKDKLNWYLSEVYRFHLLEPDSLVDWLKKRLILGPPRERTCDEIRVTDYTYLNVDEKLGHYSRWRKSWKDRDMPKSGPEEREKLPTWVGIQYLRDKMKDGKEAATCAICFEEVDDTKEFQVTPCNHAFHASCLQEWLNSNMSCPMCRFPFLYRAWPCSP